MPRVTYSKPAISDIAKIGAHIAKHNKPVSVSFVASIKEKCQTIASAPLIGREHEDYGAGIRSFPLGNYVIFYQPDSFGITVVRVLHGARDIARLMSEEPGYS
ncbi:type II toxin-antitoxin system RelE/ParE family toxin [Magnetospirillum sp. 15-1]|uniref:type II toxin-antitoxin system RelE/ParE family toxin n=1 Tax=Magnetospirillum sp. 15-1 TaxID=1979370 RepID=UPI000BBC71EA|nr:type II toxin-antitoxin system RelE/ParE family toxin [Magnetospirillum sp. 15-1]